MDPVVCVRALSRSSTRAASVPICSESNFCSACWADSCRCTSLIWSTARFTVCWRVSPWADDKDAALDWTAAAWESRSRRLPKKTAPPVATKTRANTHRGTQRDRGGSLPLWSRFEIAHRPISQGDDKLFRCLSLRTPPHHIGMQRPQGSPKRSGAAWRLPP